MPDSTTRGKAITLAMAILCGVGLWLVFKKASQRVDDKLNKVMTLLETVETDIDNSVAKLPKKLSDEVLANVSLIKTREEEIIQKCKEPGIPGRREDIINED